MRKLLLSLALCAALLGCTVTPQKTELVSDTTFEVAVRSLNAAYLFGAYSKAEHDTVRVFVDAGNSALQKYHDDLKAGNTSELQRDLDAFNVAAQMVVAENKRIHPQ